MNIKVNTKSTKKTVEEIKKGSDQLKKEVDDRYIREDSREIINAIDRKTGILDD